MLVNRSLFSFIETHFWCCKCDFTRYWILIKMQRTEVLGTAFVLWASSLEHQGVTPSRWAFGSWFDLIHSMPHCTHWSVFNKLHMLKVVYLENICCMCFVSKLANLQIFLHTVLISMTFMFCLKKEAGKHWIVFWKVGQWVCI